MSTLNELNADSVVAAALVAGAFSLVVQGAVRVWEVRQTRVRDRVDAYVAHLMFVRRFITDSILIGDQARRLRQLGEEFDDLDASKFKTPTGELDVVRFQRERARYECLHADYDRQRRELQERADALMDAHIEQEFRFKLIAKPPVLLRDVQLSRLTAQLGEADVDPDAISEEIHTAIVRLSRTASFEARAAGSIGFALLAHTLSGRRRFECGSGWELYGWAQARRAGERGNALRCRSVVVVNRRR